MSVPEAEKPASPPGISRPPPIVSYSQNLEDVMLWRALHKVRQGFYVDVGAAWPAADSVTKAFYDAGWRGVNVEPNGDLHRELALARPRDINLHMAIGDQPGRATIHVFADTGLSTLDGEIAKLHSEAGLKSKSFEVEVTTLAQLWEQSVPSGQEVHFLKVDVEGLEEKVLRGNDWHKNRPWIVVVEATVPMSQRESHVEWEAILEMAKYQLAYMDGLNRFYVAEERGELRKSFTYPPNVFDGYVLNSHREVEARAQEAQRALRQTESAIRDAATKAEQQTALAQAAVLRAEQAEVRADSVEGRVRQAEEVIRKVTDRARTAESEVDWMRGTRSWKVTRPLRGATTLMRETKSVARTWAGRAKRAAKPLFTEVLAAARQKQSLKSQAKRVLVKLPSLRKRVSGWVQSVAPESTEVSASGKRVLAALTAAMESRRSRGR